MRVELCVLNDTSGEFTLDNNRNDANSIVRSSGGRVCSGYSIRYR